MPVAIFGCLFDTTIKIAYTIFRQWSEFGMTDKSRASERESPIIEVKY